MTPEDQLFKDRLIDLLKNDEDVYYLILRRCIDILDTLGYSPWGPEK